MKRVFTTHIHIHHISVANKRRAHIRTYIQTYRCICIHTLTHRRNMYILSLAAIVHRINTHFKNTSSIRTVAWALCIRVQDTFDMKVARGSLPAHKPWKCFIQRQQTKLNRTENCVSTVRTANTTEHRTTHNTQHNTTQRIISHSRAHMCTHYNLASFAFKVAKSSTVFSQHTC